MSKTSTLKKSISKFPKIKTLKAESPSEEVINAILNYSKALSVRPSKYIKQVELILN